MPKELKSGLYYKIKTEGLKKRYFFIYLYGKYKIDSLYSGSESNFWNLENEADQIYVPIFKTDYLFANNDIDFLSKNYKGPTDWHSFYKLFNKHEHLIDDRFKFMMTIIKDLKNA